MNNNVSSIITEYGRPPKIKELDCDHEKSAYILEIQGNTITKSVCINNNDKIEISSKYGKKIIGDVQLANLLYVAKLGGKPHIICGLNHETRIYAEHLKNFIRINITNLADVSASKDHIFLFRKTDNHYSIFMVDKNYTITTRCEPRFDGNKRIVNNDGQVLYYSGDEDDVEHVNNYLLINNEYLFLWDGASKIKYDIKDIDWIMDEGFNCFSLSKRGVIKQYQIY